jgi:hypothetical protein
MISALQYKIGGGGGETPAPVGATLIKTGQTTSYRTGDDGDIEAGRATSFSVLASNNPFGNTNRFTDELGGQTFTNNIVIDWSTYNGTNVLGYRRTASATAVTWDNAIDGALAVSIGSFTSGWRLTNIREVMNIMNYEGGASFANRLNYSPLNINEAVLWTSTTVYTASTFAYQLTNNGTGFNYAGKTTTAKYIPCRTFTVTGTTLT